MLHLQGDRERTKDKRTLQPICPFIGLPGSLILSSPLTSHWSEQSYTDTLRAKITFLGTVVVKNEKSRCSSMGQILSKLSPWGVPLYVCTRKLRRVSNEDKSIATFPNPLGLPQIISNYFISHNTVNNECQGIHFRQRNWTYWNSKFIQIRIQTEGCRRIIWCINQSFC